MNTKPIAVYVPSLRGGGAERVAINLLKGFVQSGQRVDLVLAQAVGPNLSLVPDDIRIVDLKASGVLSSLPGLVRYLKCERPDALLAVMSHANVVATVAKKLARVRVRTVLSEHNSLSSKMRNAMTLRNRLLPHLMRFTYPLANSVVCVSQGAFIGLA